MPKAACCSPLPAPAACPGSSRQQRAAPAPRRPGSLGPRLCTCAAPALQHIGREGCRGLADLPQHSASAPAGGLPAQIATALGVMPVPGALSFPPNVTHFFPALNACRRSASPPPSPPSLRHHGASMAPKGAGQAAARQRRLTAARSSRGSSSSCLAPARLAGRAPLPAAAAARPWWLRSLPTCRLPALRRWRQRPAPARRLARGRPTHRWPLQHG
jgi:hypothetical protein